MKKILIKAREYYEKDREFLTNSLILFSCTLFLNITGYVYHLFMGRLLGPEDYGILGSLQAIIYIMIIPMNTIQTSITNFTARFRARNENGKISFLLSDSLKKIAIYGGAFTLLFFLLSPLIASFLKLPSIFPLLSLGVFMFAAFLIAVGRGALQGLQRFWALGANHIFEGIIKLGAGVSLVLLGMGINGAINGGFTLSYILPFLASMIVLLPVLKTPKTKFDSSHVYKYSLPVLLTMIVMTSIYTIDMILVKHFFSSTESGYYAAIALIGKIIFFGSISIALVMFPRVAELKEKRKDFKKTIRKAVAVTSLFCTGVTLFYFLFPKLVVSILFGEKYLSIIPLIGIFGVFMSLVSITYLLAYYNLSIGRKKFLYPLVFLVLVEAVILSLFHSSLSQVIYVLLVLSSVMFASTFTITRMQRNI
jgi:O-antigen/teichoic acid export membrane protein